MSSGLDHLSDVAIDRMIRDARDTLARIDAASGDWKDCLGRRLAQRLIERLEAERDRRAVSELDRRTCERCWALPVAVDR